MDTRPLLHFWLNKPDTMDDHSDLQTCKMKVSTYQQGNTIEDMFGNCEGCMSPTWGNPYAALDLWLDVDKLIRKLPAEHRQALAEYLRGVKRDKHWSVWPEPPRTLMAVLTVIVHAIL